MRRRGRRSRLLRVRDILICIKALGWDGKHVGGLDRTGKGRVPSYQCYYYDGREDLYSRVHIRQTYDVVSEMLHYLSG